MTNAEIIDLASKVAAIAMGAYGAVAAWKIKRDETLRRVNDAETARIKAESDARADEVKTEKLRRDIERTCTEGYHHEITRLQERADKQDRRIDDLLRRIAELEGENELYRRWNKLMAAHIEANNLPPVPMPEK